MQPLKLQTHRPELSVLSQRSISVGPTSVKTIKSTALKKQKSVNLYDKYRSKNMSVASSIKNSVGAVGGHQKKKKKKKKAHGNATSITSVNGGSLQHNMSLTQQLHTNPSSTQAKTRRKASVPRYSTDVMD
jgi:hypothetical protein